MKLTAMDLKHNMTGRSRQPSAIKTGRPGVQAGVRRYVRTVNVYMTKAMAEAFDMYAERDRLGMGEAARRLYRLGLEADAAAALPEEWMPTRKPPFLPRGHKLEREQALLEVRNMRMTELQWEELAALAKALGEKRTATVRRMIAAGLAEDRKRYSEQHLG